ncbi:claudin-7-like [Agelaius tricolor]|uniref:claudin-7-like n=1 Tax=Agelaius tricolor TaxID=9191 RepID=UPI0039F20DD9
MGWGPPEMGLGTPGNGMGTPGNGFGDPRKWVGDSRKWVWGPPETVSGPLKTPWTPKKWGLLALVSCSWYGHRIVTSFYDPTIPINLKFEFGSALFLGWAGSALALLGGSLLASSCCSRGGGGAAKGGGYPRARTPPKGAPTSREYV